ncbi:DUF2118 domain-containing protein [Streptomyces sp. NPDC050560]|uniref:DUF2118 domain-containing protein n=1 Tax=Streptomyces sp. NPDC050560 TaxID=3365630 RepID=UPI003795CC06
MQFRRQALARLEAPEALDLPVRLARARGRLVLAVTVAAMAAAGYWAVTGTVTSTVDAPGLLTYGQGSYVVQSTVTGQVTDVKAREGQRVSTGQALAEVKPASGHTTVLRAVRPGLVTALHTAVGSVVTTGSDVATVERSKGAHDPLVAELYLSPTSAAGIAPGQRVDLTAATAPEQRYGVLRGTVRTVDRTARTKEQLTTALGDEDLAARLTGHGGSLTVLVTLTPSSRTHSGYAWSSPSGPPFALASMTSVDGSVRTARQHPYAWLLP